MSTNRATKSPPYGSREEIPPTDCKDYYLFLLEFFVKQASGERLAKLNQMFFVPTSVRFGFLDFVDEADLEVTPVDTLFQPQAGVANDVETFNAGKSVLFAVDRDEVVDRNARMIMRMVVSKRMPDGIKPNILVGAGVLDLSGQYAALRLETLQCWRKGITTSKEFDGQVPLMRNGDLTGDLNVFVRMSGFGQTIVTEFDLPRSQDPKTFVFAAGEDDQCLAYKCRKVDSRAVDLLQDSRENLGNSAKCPVCAPQKYPCVPCGKMAAVEETGYKTKDKQDDKLPRKSLIESTRDPLQPCGKPVVLKVSGLFDNGDGKPTVTVADGSAVAKGDDPNHDIFVLRIGKKGLVGVGEKSDIQLEMKTPKGPERRPPIRYETREMQTDVDEQAPKDMKKKKKK